MLRDSLLFFCGLTGMASAEVRPDASRELFFWTHPRLFFFQLPYHTIQQSHTIPYILYYGMVWYHTA